MVKNEYPIYSVCTYMHFKFIFLRQYRRITQLRLLRNNASSLLVPPVSAAFF